MTVRPAKTRISLGIRPVCSESSLCTQWVAKEPSFLRADSEDSDQICPGWSESSLGAQTTMLVLSWGSNVLKVSWKVSETISRFNETIDAENFA